MNHFNISIIKSIIRILGAVIALVLTFSNLFAALIVFSSSFAVAEFLGILEEIFDKRKEK